MAKYRKKAIVVTADRALTKQYVATLEGVTEASVGDYIVNGIDNEQWAVKPKWFNQSYRHIEGNKYQRIPQVLEAVQIDAATTLPTPTGDIVGDKGDYKVTGTEGEQWFVKPDIFDKTYEIVKGGTHKMEKTMLQGTIDQIGIEAVKKCMAPTLDIMYCDLHGHYAHDHSHVGATCPLCPQLPSGDGHTATQVEHYINSNPIQSLNNPQQKMNPTGV